MKKRFVAALLCLCLLVGLVLGSGATAFAASTTDYAIGDTVEFGGYSWYIIGTETKGVTAPEGCYTLLIASTTFGSTTFREGADGTDESHNYYKDSDLQKIMEEIAADFSFVERRNIVPRDLTATDDEIAGPDVNDQYVWALSQTEAKFAYGNTPYPDTYRYWTRTGEYNDDLNSGPFDTYEKYCVWEEITDSGIFAFTSELCLPTVTRYVFPALYVRASALPAPPATGDFVLGQDAISSAAVGGRLVANSGSDVGLTISQNQTADVRVYQSEANQSGSSLSFCLDHQSTTTGENQVLACVLTDGSGTVKYYGMLADCSVSDSGAIWVSVPMLWVADGTYTLSIFSHNIQTNEISQPSPTMTVTVDGGVGTVSNYKGLYKYYVITFPDPVFTKQPQSQYVTPDSSVTFSVEATQNGMSIGESSYYTWWTQDKSNPDGTWYQISGWQSGSIVAFPIKGKTLTLSNVAGTWFENDLILLAAGEDVTFQPKDARFRCVVTGIYSGSATSNAAELWVIEGTGGEDGREVELRNNGTLIQWKYEDEPDAAWRDLVALDAITGGDGADGADGREVELQVASGYIQWRYTTGADTAWKNLMSLSDLKGDSGEDGREVELHNNGTSIQWRYKGETEWKDLVALSDITGSDGADGKQVELRVEGGYIQWKYDADGDWQNLIALSALQGIKGDKGDKGDPGDTPTIGSNGNWWIGGVDTGIPATGSSGSDGADGSDGKDGQDGKDGKDGKDGEDGKDGLTPYIGSNGNWWIGTTDTGIKAAGTNGADGKDGANGKNGTNGKDGADGVGIADIKLNENGELIVTLTDSTVKNLGKVKGEDGVGISGVSINENGELIVTLTDGTELNAGAVPTAAAGDSNLKTLVYVSMGTAGVSLAGLLGLLAFLLTKRKMLIGK